MTLWRLDVEEACGDAVASHRLVRTIARAFAVDVRAVWEPVERLKLGWPAFVEAGSCDVAALRDVGVRAAPATAPPARVVASGPATGRLAAAWGPLLATLEHLAPEALRTLRGPALSMDRAAIERRFGVPLPEDYVAWLAQHDGGAGGGGPFHWELERLSGVARMQAMNDASLADVDLPIRADPEVASVWWHPRWLPFAGNGAGDALCLDLAPTARGTSGQVIEFRHDDDRRIFVAPSFTAWIARVAADVRDGRLVATEDDNTFCGMLPSAALTGSLASLRVRGEPDAARAERIQREILGNPPELARRVVSWLDKAKKLTLAQAARGPSGFALRQGVAVALGADGTPALRHAAVLEVLRTSPVVASVSATEADVAWAIDASGRC